MMSSVRLASLFLLVSVARATGQATPAKRGAHLVLSESLQIEPQSSNQEAPMTPSRRTKMVRTSIDSDGNIQARRFAEAPNPTEVGRPRDAVHVALREQDPKLVRGDQRHQVIRGADAANATEVERQPDALHAELHEQHADKLARQGRGSENGETHHRLEAANNETFPNMCPKDTGGTCGWFGCNGWRKATCNSHKKCACRAGECAVKGKCVAESQVTCPIDTGGTCGWFGCHSWRKATCSHSKCVCPAGKCAFEGKCVAESEVAKCPKDTGGTCHVLGCKSWRSASCSSGKCKCKYDQCAVDGRCVKPMSPPSETPKKVAVVGCGIAGALTALELAHRGVQVEVIDREGDCGVGTSGRIAAEMMFYSYRKAVWKGGWADVDGYAAMAWNMQGSATPSGVAYGASWHLNKKKNYAGTKVKVKLDSYKEGQLRFKSANGPPVVSHSSLPDVEVGLILKGISNCPPRDIYEMSKATDTDAQLQKYLLEAVALREEVTVEFLKGADPRTNPVYAGGFFEAASDRLRDFFLAQYPQLCEAVVSPFCCVNGTRARAWVAANPEKAGYACPDDPFAPATGGNPGLGVAHAIVSEDRLKNIKDRPAKEQERFDFELWDANQTKWRLGDWVQDGELNGHPVVGGVVNRNDGGFVRTELVFKVIKPILTELGATYKFGQEITGITPSQEGVSLSMRAAGGTWSEEGEGPKTYVFTPTEPGVVASTTSYDRVVFATGAAVGSAFDHFDPAVRNAPLLMPIHGYIVLGRGIELSEKHRAIGIVYERAHMYLRTTRSGNPAIGGGMFVNSGSDGDCRALHYRDSLVWSGFNADSYMEQAPLGKRLVEEKSTLKLGGVRPMSVFGNFPLLKSYLGGRVVLNTGGGANGFVCSWKSGQLAADLAMTGSTAEPYWTGSFTAA